MPRCRYAHISSYLDPGGLANWPVGQVAEAWERTADYQNWVEAFAPNHHTPIAWTKRAYARKTMSITFDSDEKWTRRMFEAASARMIGHIIGWG
jgi:hypothetical protein